jgi:hypothetical protein
MTDSPDQKDGKSQPPEPAESASSTTSEPVQLDLFESLERLTGDQWREETACKSEVHRDFILPPGLAKSASAPPSKDEADDD